jgi:hypothetical protein
LAIFKNKHTIIAVLVAPVLAILAWFAADVLVGEKPHRAEAGKSYELVEKPSCRWASGSCELQNGDFELALTPEWFGRSSLRLILESAFPLEGVKLALATGESDYAEPRNMEPTAADGRSWSIELDSPDPETHRLRLVAAASQSLYYGDVALTFALPPEESGR